MTESEITFQLSELFDRWWVIHQWWVSVSFGLIAVAHFAGHKLNYVLAGVILGLYTAFSLWLNFLADYNVQMIAGFTSDLGALESAGRLQSNGARAYLDGMTDARWNFWGDTARIGTFVCVIGYMSYTVIQHRWDNANQ
jgi:hypothetical protein